MVCTYSLGKLNVPRQTVKCVHTMINKEVKTSIKLGWRTEYEIADCDVRELGSAYASPPSEVTEHNTVDSDVIEMGPTYAPLVASVLGADILDQHIKRKPVSKSSDLYGGGLKQDLNINRYSSRLCKSSENVTKIRSKEYDDDGTNPNINMWDVGISSDNHVRFYSRPAKTVPSRVRLLDTERCVLRSG
jgi:hypothetical protein